MYSIHIRVPLLLSISGGEDTLQNQHRRKHTFWSFTGSVYVDRSCQLFAYKNYCCVLQFYCFPLTKNPTPRKIRKITFLYFILSLFVFSPQ